jgi:glycosyltransferase involved in cell wall biosynthesis
MYIVGIIPAYNEEGKVGEIVKRALEHVDKVLVIDDGSTDDTHRIAEDAGAEVVPNGRNLGLGLTIRRGYQEALERGADVVVQLDADGQYDPAEIPKLIAPIEENRADMVLGSRLENLQYRMPFVKKRGNRAFSWVLKWLTGADIKDGQTGFRAMRREVLETALPSSRFSYTQEMIIKVAKEGWKIESVPINFYERYDGTPRLFNSSLGFAFRGWAIILRTLRDYHPLKFFGIPGLILMLLGFVDGLYVLAHYIDTGNVSGKMPTLILGVVLFLAGLQLFFAGMLADMIKTHSDGKAR